MSFLGALARSDTQTPMFSIWTRFAVGMTKTITLPATLEVATIDMYVYNYLTKVTA